MNVLSLFDGMSCGRLALDRLDIKVDNYYAAEIDKYATQVSEANYPDIIRLGDVCKVKAKDLPKIDLILAGSPCQGFSFAGKQLAFDDPRSALFFEFVRILKECDPKYFLLENVKMKKEFLHIITQQVGVEPILINSALVSAQNRQRYYWTNIPGVEQPEQRGIVLRDVLETTPGDPTLMSDSFVARQKKNINGKCLVDQNKEKAASLSAMEYVKNDRQGDYLACNEEGVPQDNPGEFDKNLDKMTNKEGKAYCLTARYTGAVSWNSIEKKQRTMVPVMQKPKQVETAADINSHDIMKRVYSPEGKSPSLTANGGGNREPKVVSGAWRARSVDENGKRVDWKETTPKQMLELRKDEKANSVTSVQKDNVVVSAYEQVTEDEAKGARMVGRAYDEDGKRLDRDGTSVAGLTTQMIEVRKDGKSNAITTVGKDSLVVSNELPLPEEDIDERIVVDEEKKQLKNDSDVYWRKLTPLECMRLQTVPDDYLMPVSNTQIYKMLGNGWTIEVIAHILQNMKTLEEGGEVAERKGQIGFEF